MSRGRGETWPSGAGDEEDQYHGPSARGGRGAHGVPSGDIGGGQDNTQHVADSSEQHGDYYKESSVAKSSAAEGDCQRADEGEEVGPASKRQSVTQSQKTSLTLTNGAVRSKVVFVS